MSPRNSTPNAALRVGSTLLLRAPAFTAEFSTALQIDSVHLPQNVTVSAHIRHLLFPGASPIDYSVRPPRNTAAPARLALPNTPIVNASPLVHGLDVMRGNLTPKLSGPLRISKHRPLQIGSIPLLREPVFTRVFPEILATSRWPSLRVCKSQSVLSRNSTPNTAALRIGSTPRLLFRRQCLPPNSVHLLENNSHSPPCTLYITLFYSSSTSLLLLASTIFLPRAPNRPRLLGLAASASSHCNLFSTSCACPNVPPAPLAPCTRTRLRLQPLPFHPGRHARADLAKPFRVKISNTVAFAWLRYNDSNDKAKRW